MGIFLDIGWAYVVVMGGGGHAQHHMSSFTLVSLDALMQGGGRM